MSSDRTAPLAGWLHEERRGDIGANVSLRNDPEGLLHFCYQDGGSDSLYYLAPALEREEWVDDGIRLDLNGRGHASHVVGEDCSLHFDREGRVILVYQDASAHQILASRRDAGGNWLRLPLRESEGSAGGFYARAVLDREDLFWISHYVYDQQREPPEEYLEIFQRESP